MANRLGFFLRLVGNPISFFIDCVDCYSVFCMWIVDKFGVLIFLGCGG